MAEVDVRLARLPAASDGTTIVQLSDMHVGATIGRAFVEDVVRRTNALQPDIVAITGDLVDGSVENLWEAVAPLARAARPTRGLLRDRQPRVLLGRRRPGWRRCGRLNIRVLDNERVAIGPDGGGFDLAGVHDHGAAPDAGATAHGYGQGAGRTGSRPRVRAAGPPAQGDRARPPGSGSACSCPGTPTADRSGRSATSCGWRNRIVAGLHRHGDTQIYVNPGTGYWGPPMRLGTRAGDHPDQAAEQADRLIAGR